MAGNVFEDLLGCTGAFEDVLEDVSGAAGSVEDEGVFKDEWEDIVGLEGGGIFEEGVGGTSGFWSKWGIEGDGWLYLELREQ